MITHSANNEQFLFVPCPEGDNWAFATFYGGELKIPGGETFTLPEGNWEILFTTSDALSSEERAAMIVDRDKNYFGYLDYASEDGLPFPYAIPSIQSLLTSKNIPHSLILKKVNNV